VLGLLQNLLKLLCLSDCSFPDADCVILT